MNKSELVAAVSAKTGHAKGQVETILETINETIIETVRTGDDVKLVGFGSYTRQVKPQRQGRNPRTGEPVTIAESKTLKFKPGQPVVDRLSKR